MYQISVHLRKEGVDISFIQFDKDTNGYSLFHFPKHQMNRFKVSPDFFKWIDELPSSESIIFHLHNAFYRPNFQIARYLQKKNIPYVFTPHDSYSPESMEGNKVLKRIYLFAIDRYILKKQKLYMQ